MEELISVIVPVYNVEKYLHFCLESITNQTYKNLEIVLVDDGSTDGSGHLCDEWQKKDSRIAVYHKQNGGLSDARNFGMSRGKGTFLAFIDSDDVLHKDFFAALMKAQMEADADIAACELTLFYDHNELNILCERSFSAEPRMFSGKDALKEYFNTGGARTFYHGLCMKIYRKTLFDGMQFEKGRLHEDVYITYKLLDKANKVVYLESPYYFYFQNNDASICKNYGSKNFLDEAEAYENMYHYFVSRNRVTQELLRFLIIRYVNMLEIGYKVRNIPDVKEKTNHIKTWIGEHVDDCNILETKKHIVVTLALTSIPVLHYIRQIKDRLLHE